MVGFGKIMHLEVTKMTDGSTTKLVEAYWRILPLEMGSRRPAFPCL